MSLVLGLGSIGSINLEFVNQIRYFSSSYPIILTRLDGPRPNPLLIVGVLGIKPTISYLRVRHADHSANEAVYY